MKRVIQIYKAMGQWKNGHPGVGDFLRGTCMLYECLKESGIDLRMDISRSDLSRWIHPDSDFFCTSSAAAENVEEYFVASGYMRLLAGLEQFKRGQDMEFPVCTNLGDWFCGGLTKQTREFMKPFYHFVPAITEVSAAFRESGPYQVLSIRCGDRFFGNAVDSPEENDRKRVYDLIELEILPAVKTPVVIMSDSLILKAELAQRYGFRATSHLPEHSGWGGAFSTSVDLDILRHSSRNYHLNLWAPWWSGFSHFTSLIFSIPSTNWRNPDFVREEVPVLDDDACALTLHAQMAWRLVVSAEIQRTEAQEDVGTLRGQLLATSRELILARAEIKAALKEIRGLQKQLDEKSSRSDMLETRLSRLVNGWTWLGWRLMPWTKPAWRHHPFEK